jgi:hypothetical protein
MTQFPWSIHTFYDTSLAVFIVATLQVCSGSILRATTVSLLDWPILGNIYHSSDLAPFDHAIL